MRAILVEDPPCIDLNVKCLELHNSLDSLGIHNVYFESQGTAHEWLTWRRDLREFAPLLFGTTHANKQ
jgi:S-formylglutathione hydrolase FrmB